MSRSAWQKHSKQVWVQHARFLQHIPNTESNGRRKQQYQGSVPDDEEAPMPRILSPKASSSSMPLASVIVAGHIAIHHGVQRKLGDAVAHRNGTIGQCNGGTDTWVANACPCHCMDFEPGSRGCCRTSMWCAGVL